MSKIRFLPSLAALLFCLSVFAPLSRAAGPVLQATYSERVLDTDEYVTVEAAFSWPRDDGPYYFFPPEWKLENLIFLNRSRSEDTFFGAEDRIWQRVIFRYEFKPVVEGKALIGFIRFSYLCAPTQETGTVTVVRQMEYQVWRKRDYLLMLTDMLCLMSSMLFAASLLILLYTKYSLKKKLDEQKAKDMHEFAAIPGRIEKMQGSQKEQAFEWGNQFKLFLVYHYQLPKTVLTEREAADALSHAPGVSDDDVKKISAFFDQLSSVKFSTKEWEEGPLERLKNDMLDFIRRRI